MEINVIYPTQADFAPQLQKLEASINRRNGFLIDKLQKVPNRACDRPQSRQANSGVAELMYDIKIRTDKYYSKWDRSYSYI